MSISHSQGAGGTRFTICRRWTWKALAFYALFGCMYLRSVGAVLPRGWRIPQEPWPSMLPMFLLLAFIAIATNRRLIGGCERITVSDSTLTIETRLLGFTTTRREFANQQVKGLRCDAWFPTARYEWKESGLGFEYEGQTIRFGLDSTEAKAMRLLEQMNAVYPFRT